MKWFFDPLSHGNFSRVSPRSVQSLSLPQCLDLCWRSLRILVQWVGLWMPSWFHGATLPWDLCYKRSSADFAFKIPKLEKWRSQMFARLVWIWVPGMNGEEFLFLFGIWAVFVDRPLKLWKDVNFFLDQIWRIKGLMTKSLMFTLSPIILVQWKMAIFER